MTPGITVRPPSAVEEDLHRRFTVNRHYLQALRQFLETTYGKGPHLHTTLRTSVESRKSWQAIQRKADPDTENVRRFLMLGWTSEAQLQMPSTLGDGAPIGHFNAWAPVQAYYAAYGIMQAWFAANDIDGLTDDHTAALKTMSAMIRERNLLPEPWNLLAIGCPMRDERLYLNGPPGFDCAASIEFAHGPDASRWTGRVLASVRHLASSHAQSASTPTRGRLEEKEREGPRLAAGPNDICERPRANIAVRLSLANANTRQLWLGGPIHKLIHS